MSKIFCSKCESKGFYGACTRREMKRVVGGTKEHYEHIKHQDGSVERKVWARIDVKSDKLLSAQLV